MFYETVLERDFSEKIMLHVKRWHHSGASQSKNIFISFSAPVPHVIALFKSKMHKLTAMPWICLAIIILCPIMRILTLIYTSKPDWNWDTTYYNWNALYFPSHLRADSLCFGVLIGYLFRYRRNLATKIASAKWIGIPLVLFSFAVPLIWHSQKHWLCCTLGFSFIALGFSWLVLAAGIFSRDWKKRMENIRLINPLQRTRVDWNLFLHNLPRPFNHL